MALQLLYQTPWEFWITTISRYQCTREIMLLHSTTFCLDGPAIAWSTDTLISGWGVCDPKFWLNCGVPWIYPSEVIPWSGEFWFKRSIFPLYILWAFIEGYSCPGDIWNSEGVGMWGLKLGMFIEMDMSDGVVKTWGICSNPFRLSPCSVAAPPDSMTGPGVSDFWGCGFYLVLLSCKGVFGFRHWSWLVTFIFVLTFWINQVWEVSAFSDLFRFFHKAKGLH